MSLWKSCLLVVGIFVVVFAALLVGVIKIFPKYAEGEAIAVVKADYPAYDDSSLNADYQGQGRWEVTTDGVQTKEDGSMVNVHFLVYEQTNTVEIFEEEVLIGAPGPSGSTGHPSTPHFIALGANVVIFFAHVLFAVIFWSRKRRAGVAQVQNT